MRIEFYHVDAFEVANYEPIWRALRRLGASAHLIGPPEGQNRAIRGWFDYEAFLRVCSNHGLPFATEADPTAVGVTTQNSDIVEAYCRPHIRLMYGPVMYPSAWGLSERVAIQFDCILAHGPHYQRRFAAWKPADQIPVVGYPRYDDFFAGKLDVAGIRRKHGLETSKPTLLYLPTWSENSSFDQYFDFIAETQREFQVVVRPHHCMVRFEAQRMARLAAAGVTVCSDPFDLPKLMAVTDLVVADARSCSLLESLMCGRRALGLALDRQADEPWIQSTGLAALAPCCYKPENLLEMVSRAHEGPANTAARDAWREQHVAYRDGSAAERAAQAILTAIEKTATRRCVTRLEAPQVSAVHSPGAPLVSVVLPTYNHLKFLPAAIDSLIGQSFGNFELIIVNDGSTDGTREYLDQLKDPRIRVIHQENQRLPGALNAGFKAARGQLLTWVSADNFAAPIFLEALVAALEAHPEAGWAVSAFAWTDSDGRITGIQRDQDLSLPSLLKCNPGIASFMYRRTCQQAVGDYDPSLEGAEDWDVWLRMAERSPAVYVSEILYYYRHHADSMTQRIPDRVRKSSCEVFYRAKDRWGGHFDLHALYPAIAKCSNRNAAETQACFDLGTRMLRSPFIPAQAAAFFLSSAFDKNHSPETLFNLAAAFIKIEAWDPAARSVFLLQKVKHAEIQRRLPQLVEAVCTRNGFNGQDPALFDLDAASELLSKTRASRLTYSLSLAGAAN